MAWKLWVVSAVLFAASVNAVSPATFPPPPCTGASPKGEGPQSVCSYITDDKLGLLTPASTVNAADKRKCCNSFVPIDVTSCTTACQRSVTAVSCSLACTPLNTVDTTGPKICSKDIIELYTNCYTCTAFSNALTKKIPQPTSTSTDVLAATALQWWSTKDDAQFLKFPDVTPVYPRALLGEGQCTAAYTSACTPTTKPTVTGISVKKGEKGDEDVPKTGSDYNVAAATGDMGTKITLVATATGLGCTPTDFPPTKGRWEVRAEGKVLAELAEDVWTPDWTADGTKFKTKPKTIYLFTSDGADTKYTVTFTATNAVGISDAQTVTLVQTSATDSTPLVAAAAAGPQLCSRTERIGPNDNSGTVLVKQSPTTGTVKLVLANQKDTQKRCTLIGIAGTPRTEVTQPLSIGCDQSDATRKAHCTLLENSIKEASYSPECTDKSRTILQNVLLTSETQTFFGCVVLNNSIIGTEAKPVTLAAPVDPVTGTAFTTPPGLPPLSISLDSASSLLLGGIADKQTVYISGDGTLYLFKGPGDTYKGSLVVGDNVKVIYKNADPFKDDDVTTGSIETFGNNVKLLLSDLPAGTTTITCGGTKSKLFKGDFNANTGTPTKIIKLSTCTGDSFPKAVASRKFLTTAGPGECGTMITSGCNGNTVPVHLVTPPPPRRCFTVGDGSNTDSAKCTAVTQSVNDDISFRYIAQQGADNGPIELQKQAKMLFYNAAPDFGAFWAPGTDALANKFDPSARLEVTLAPSVDKGDIVNIPLIICFTDKTPTQSETNCCGAPGSRPTLDVVNADGRNANLLCATGTGVTKKLFPSIFKTAKESAADNIISILYLQLQPKPTTSTVSSGVVPGYTSASTYCVNLDQNPAVYTADAFRNDVLSTLSVQPEFFEVASYVRNNDNQALIRACFICKDLSNTAQADARCSDIRNKLLFDTTLNSKTKARSDAGTELRNVNNGSGSNTALYGLFALAIIPVLLFFAICLFIMNRTRKADNQYAQDTSTFSTVAAQPYPAYGKDLYPSTPIAYA